MAPSTRQSKAATAKQSTLSFRSTKPGAGPAAKAKQSAVVSAKRASLIKSDDEVDAPSKGGARKKTEVVKVIEEVAFDRSDLHAMEKHDKKLKAYYRKVRTEQLGGLNTIHTEGQTKAELVLRVFDNSHQYGPCVGVTRLERWERAQAMGLEPPTEVRDILLTKQSVEETKFSHPVFHGEV